MSVGPEPPESFLETFEMPSGASGWMGPLYITVTMSQYSLETPIKINPLRDLVRVKNMSPSISTTFESTKTFQMMLPSQYNTHAHLHTQTIDRHISTSLLSCQRATRVGGF